MRAKRVRKAYFARTAHRRVHRPVRSHFLSVAAIELLLMALRPSDWPPHFQGAWIILKSELEVPDDLARYIALKCISAAYVAATALRAEKGRPTTKEAQVVITNYVMKVAKIWSEAGLKSSRAIRSKFHRFAELILVAITAPWSLQHELRELPAESQPWKTMQNAGYQWMVRDDHVRKAFRQTGP